MAFLIRRRPIGRRPPGHRRATQRRQCALNKRIIRDGLITGPSGSRQAAIRRKADTRIRQVRARKSGNTAPGGSVTTDGGRTVLNAGLTTPDHDRLVAIRGQAQLRRIAILRGYISRRVPAQREPGGWLTCPTAPTSAAAPTISWLGCSASQFAPPLAPEPRWKTRTACQTMGDSWRICS